MASGGRHQADCGDVGIVPRGLLLHPTSATEDGGFHGFFHAQRCACPCITQMELCAPGVSARAGHLLLQRLAAVKMQKSLQGTQTCQHVTFFIS